MLLDAFGIIFFGGPPRWHVWENPSDSSSTRAGPHWLSDFQANFLNSLSFFFIFLIFYIATNSLQVTCINVLLICYVLKIYQLIDFSIITLGAYSKF